MASAGTAAAVRAFGSVGEAGAGGVGGVAVRAVGDEADVDGGGVGHDDDFVGGGDGDGAVVLVDLDGLGYCLGLRRSGCEDGGCNGENGEAEDFHRSSPFESMESSRAAR